MTYLDNNHTQTTHVKTLTQTGYMQNNMLKIVPITLSDLKQVMQIEQNAFGGNSYTYSFFREAIELFGDAFQGAYYTNPTASASEKSGDTGLVGYILAAPYTKNKHESWILSIGVQPDMWGKNIATTLLGETILQLQKMQTQKIKLTVDPQNLRAKTLYQRYGFKTITYKPEYFGPEKDREIMQLTLHA